MCDVLCVNAGLTVQFVQVRCDRGIPCSNCQDQNVSCTRQRRRRRLPKRVQNRPASADHTQPHSPSWAFPVEAIEGSLHSQLPDSHTSENSHPCDYAPKVIPMETSEVGFACSESPLPTRNEMISTTPSLRPIEIELNSLRMNNDFQQDLIRHAQRVLESALLNATQTVPVSKTGLDLDRERTEPSELVSPEFLAWMLQGRKAALFASKRNQM